VRTIFGGDKDWNSFIESNWAPQMNKSTMQDLIKESGLK